MARALIGWELGANRGHAVTIGRIVAALQGAGHEVTLALQQVDIFGTARDMSIPVYQAPLWPAMIVSGPAVAPTRVATFTDILCRLGLTRPGALAAMISAWEGIIGAVRPDIVIAEFAPVLQVAARGRVPVVSIGTGFAHPPSHVAAMPRLTTETGYDEALLLDTIDAELRSVGREPLPALPAFFATDHSLIATFAEIDPYSADRLGDYCPPVAPVPPLAGGGDEIFAYALERDTGRSPFWDALAATGCPVRTHVPDASPEFAARLRRSGLVVEPHAIRWDDIARRSRLVVSHGGHGFVCSALIAGIPHVVAHYDMEKLLHGHAIETQGLGRSVALRTTDSAALASVVAEAYADAPLHMRAQSAAAGFRARMISGFEERLLVLMPG